MSWLFFFFFPLGLKRKTLCRGSVGRVIDHLERALCFVYAARLIIADCPDFEAPERFTDLLRVEENGAMPDL